MTHRRKTTQRVCGGFLSMLGSAMIAWILFMGLHPESGPLISSIALMTSLLFHASFGVIVFGIALIVDSFFTY